MTFPATVVISRDQYNRLIERYPLFMSEDWTKHFNREWTAGGIIVSVKIGHSPSWMYCLGLNLKSLK